MSNQFQMTGPLIDLSDPSDTPVSEVNQQMNNMNINEPSAPPPELVKDKPLPPVQQPGGFTPHQMPFRPPPPMQPPTQVQPPYMGAPPPTNYGNPPVNYNNGQYHTPPSQIQGVPPPPQIQGIPPPPPSAHESYMPPVVQPPPKEYIMQPPAEKQSTGRWDPPMNCKPKIPTEPKPNHQPYFDPPYNQASAPPLGVGQPYPYPNGPYGNESYKAPYGGPYGNETYNSPSNGPYGNEPSKPLYPPVSSIYPPKPPIHSVCQKYNISEEQLLDTKGRTQIAFIDDSYSNITEAFIDENRSGQIIEASEMIVELNSVHNSFPVTFKLLNCFWMDRNDVYTVEEFKDWSKNIEWNGGTMAGERLNIILKEYFQEWNQNPDVKPINIIYMGDGAIEDLVKKYIPCVVHAAEEAARRGKPRQITFQMFQVGKDPNATESFEFMDNELKVRYNMKCDVVDCVYGDKPLKEKILKALVGAASEYVDNKYN